MKIKTRQNVSYPVGGGLNFGLRAMFHQKDPTFFRSPSPKDPHFHQLSPNDPLFLTKSLSPKDPDTSLSLRDPSFLHLIIKQVTIFSKKIGFFKNFDKFDKMLRNFWPFWPWKPIFFWCTSLKDPLFLYALSLKNPLFWRNVSAKDPYIWGAWWHSYVTFICECPPGCPTPACSNDLRPGFVLLLQT